MNLSKLYKGTIFSSVILLSGCGGSDNSSETTINPVNTPPTIEVSDVSVNEKDNVSITAIATDDGSIASYAWQVLSEHIIELNGEDSETLTFVAPEVMSETVIELLITVTDDKGVSTKSNVNVNVNQLTISFTINGLATDSPIMNGEVTVKISGSDTTFQSTTDEQGYYSVPVKLDDSQASAMLSIEVHGVGNQESAGLISLLGSVNQLKENAGVDDVLTVSENFATTVNNFTTALYALMKGANESNEIISQIQFEDLKQKVNTSELLTLATAIKVAIDKSDQNAEFALPTEVINTLELVENIKLTKEYVSKISEFSAFSEARQEIFNDDSFSISTGNNTPSSYYLLGSNSDHLNRDGSFIFNDDGSGISHFTRIGKDSNESNFNWEVDKNEIIITFDAPYTTYVDWRFDSFFPVELHYQISSYRIRRLSSSEGSDILQITTNQRKHYPNNEYEDTYFSEVKLQTALKNTLPINIDDLKVAYLRLPTKITREEDPDSFKEIKADKFNFNSDGTGTSQVLEKSFQWENIDGQIVITPDNIDDYRLIVKQLNNSNVNANTYLVESVNYDEENLKTSIFAKTIGHGAMLNENMNWQAVTAPGIYRSTNSLFNEPLSYFWFELNEDGSLYQINTHDSDENGELSAYEIQLATGEWHINTDGSLTIITWMSNVTGSYDPNCNALSVECYTNREQTWNLIEIKGQQHVLFNHSHDLNIPSYDHETSTWSNIEIDEQSWTNTSIYKIQQRPANIDAKFID
ncbi:PKD domain-containing protein [Thalassotalea castellviae]|uniref:PKD/Chitinase domain-containing protein n=1 Tax=Thalassotalea castellviae TaxID=3075612 RepID=A0ABU3A068_9GAMM|nr:hypothetical protein [Thalassotalea sp. W431]MDT0603559.1 hypothetical protein [Thalassotalea sp. W431]